MAPLQPIAPPAAALVCALLLLAAIVGGSGVTAAAVSSPPLQSSPSSSFFFGHLPRTRYPAAAQSWRATPPGAPVFAHLARGDVLAALVAANASAVPASFSWCDVGGANLCAASWQQHNAAMPPSYCGSCFLHATLSALQDRIKGARHLNALSRRASNAAAASSPPAPQTNAAAAAAAAATSPPGLSNLQDVVLGRQAFLNCAPVHGFSKGCNGGEPLDVYHYMARFGLPDEGCVPYSATDHTRFEKKKKKKGPTAAAVAEGGGDEADNNTDEEDEEADTKDEGPTSWTDAAPTAAEALRAARGANDDANEQNDDGGSAAAAEYLLRGDPKCRGPERGKRQCMNCMPLPDDPKHPVDEDADPIPAQCWAVERPVRYGVKAFGKVSGGEAGMQREIAARGPIVCGIACPEKFVYGYKGGVYVDDGADKELDHDVEVVGWGEEEVVEEEEGEEQEEASPSLVAAAGQGAAAAAAAAANKKPATKTTTRKYWLVRNSWGTYWGELGYFKLERGTNALQIESGEDGAGDCWWAEPDLAFEDDVAAGRGWLGSMYGIRPRRGLAEGEEDAVAVRGTMDEGLAVVS